MFSQKDYLMFCRLYLRASTKSQDAERAKQSLIEFAAKHGQKIASFYVENESGRKLARPELFRLLEESSKGDILLIESIDRLTRLKSEDWSQLKILIRQKGIHIVAEDLPTSHKALSKEPMDDLTKGILDAVNDMLIDILATISSRDYETRRARAAQGVKRVREANPDAFSGRRENVERNAGIAKMLNDGWTYSEIQRSTGASRTTIAKIRARNPS
jgi:DNA invertase Pin-like site-specific DNA recombinase